MKNIVMKQIVFVIGGIYGFLAVIFGAFGAHLFKSILSADKLISFDTGVRYQMYHHALLLFILGFIFDFISCKQKIMVWSIIVGVFLFSFSIYFLALASVWGIKLGYVPMLTPIGGLLLMIGWVLLLFNVPLKAVSR